MKRNLSILLVLTIGLVGYLVLGQKSANTEREMKFKIIFDSSNTEPRLNYKQFACIPMGQVDEYTDYFGSKQERKSIFDVGWATSSIEMFDGAKNLIGVPDNLSVALLGDLKCSVTFEFGNLSLEQGPIRIESPSTKYGWDFSPSDWLDGYVSGIDSSGLY